MKHSGGENHKKAKMGQPLNIVTTSGGKQEEDKRAKKGNGEGRKGIGMKRKKKDRKNKETARQRRAEERGHCSSTARIRST